jgi:putative aldouronate transport system permease protein
MTKAHGNHKAQGPHTKARIPGRSRNDRIFDAVLFVILTAVFLAAAYPLYFVIIASFSSPKAVSGGSVVFLPVSISLEGYAKVFENRQVISGFINSIIITTTGTLISLIITLPTAYALSRRDFGGRKWVMTFYIVTMFVSGGLIPTYLVVKNLAMLDKIWSLVLPGALGVYNMIVARTFFKTSIPDELLEAARIDGCNDFRFFFRMVLPLSGAIIAILVLYYGIGQWNAYFSALLYISTPKKYPLQVVLRSILIQNSMSYQGAVPAQQLAELEYRRQVAELMKYSLIIISSLPVIIVYPFIQKHFVKGVMIGSVKG